MNLPFQQKEHSENTFIRKFEEKTSSDEFKWHKDNEDRIVTPMHKTNWMFQRENKLPEPIVNEIKIKAGEWHRIIKGTGDLELKIIKN